MRAIMIAVPLFMLTTAFAQAQEWQTYSDTAAGFSIQFPGQPELKTRTEQMPTGPLQESRISVSHDKTDFAVSVDDHSQQNISSDPQRIVQNGLDAVTGGIPGTIRSQSAFDVPNGAGREIVISTDTYTARIKLYYVAPYAYTLVVLTDDKVSWDSLMTGDSDRFFSSFQLLKK